MTSVPSVLALGAIAAFITSPIALAGAPQRLDIGLTPVGGLVTGGAFPTPIDPANLGSVSGTLQLFQEVQNPAFLFLNVNNTGTQFPGWVVEKLHATVVVQNGQVAGAFFDVQLNDGSFFQALGGGAGGGLDLSFDSDGYRITGAITNFSMNGPNLGGVDVSGPFGAQPLMGSFFDFGFFPTGNSRGDTFVDFNTDLYFSVMGPTVIPLPSAAGMAGAGLLLLATRRRRA